MSFNDKVALVTGASRGIGRAVALALSDAGAAVVLVARNGDELAATADLVTGRGGTAVPLVADLGDTAALNGLVGQAADALGPVDLLINNAGTEEPLGPSAGMDPKTWAAAFDVNVFAPAALSFAVLPHMTQGRWGRIVNVSSGIVAHPGGLVGGNAYVATKGALEAHTLNLAAELAGTGVTANVYRPGAVDTAMQARIRDTGQGRVGDATHAYFVRSLRDGTMITPEQSAQSLVRRLEGDDSGKIWDVSDLD